MSQATAKRYAIYVPSGHVEASMRVAAFSATEPPSTSPSGLDDGNAIHLPTLLVLTERVAIYMGRQRDGVYHLSLIRPQATELTTAE